MNCYRHNDVHMIGICRDCGRAVCSDCADYFEGTVLCMPGCRGFIPEPNSMAEKRIAERMRIEATPAGRFPGLYVAIVYLLYLPLGSAMLISEDINIRIGAAVILCLLIIILPRIQNKILKRPTRKTGLGE